MARAACRAVPPRRHLVPGGVSRLLPRGRHVSITLFSCRRFESASFRLAAGGGAFPNRRHVDPVLQRGVGSRRAFSQHAGLCRDSGGCDSDRRHAVPDSIFLFPSVRSFHAYRHGIAARSRGSRFASPGAAGNGAAPQSRSKPCVSQRGRGRHSFGRRVFLLLSAIQRRLPRTRQPQSVAHDRFHRGC